MDKKFHTGMIEWIKKEKAFIFLILGILLFRGSFVNWYRVPSESMVPTLLVGDYIVVNRLAYAVNLPFSQMAIMQTGDIRRGDIIVFDYPPDESILFVKRMIGLPGDHIKISEGKVYINGKQICIPNCEVYTSGEFDFTVKPDEFFVLGDNRGNSADSRVWGFVPRKNIRGRAHHIGISLRINDYYMPIIDWSRTARKLNSSADFPDPVPPSDIPSGA